MSSASNRTAVLSLGSNLGNRLGSLQSAIDSIRSHHAIRVVAVSSVYETAPVGGPDQPPYLNAVVNIETSLAPNELLDVACEVEESQGRVRRERWGPRTLDVDLIVVGDEVSDDAALTLPHPRAHERAFVLIPWNEIDPDALIPGVGPVAELLVRMDVSGVDRFPGVLEYA